MIQTIVIGVSSGIADYKILDLIKILKAKNYEIYVIMTKHAAMIVDPKEFEEVSGHKAYIDLFPKGFDYRKVLKEREVEHIRLADSASLFVIAPATANIIGKLAAGIADDFLTTTFLASTAPVLVCPSMNPHMWGNLIVQENIKKLKQLGCHILVPDSGRLACGYKGIGRLPEIKNIAVEILQILTQSNKLKGKRFIVTAGGTTEEIDKVRVITNRSSGKMGVALAEQLFRQGAEVLLIRASSAVACRYDLKEEIFETAQDLSRLVHKNVSHYDAIFHAAAVSDFRARIPIKGKIDSNSPITLNLVPTVKILSQIKIWNPRIKLIAFKAVYEETEKNLIKNGIEKLKESRSDYIIVNDIGKKGVGFGVDTNEVYIISPNGSVKKIDKASKTEVARKILEYIFKQ